MRPPAIQVGDEVCVGSDHGVVTEIEGREVWYRSLEDDQIRKTFIGDCVWVPSTADREALQKAIVEGWDERERQTRIVGQPDKKPRVETQVVDSSQVDHLLTVNRDFNWSMW